jgi:hypothetical protein
MKQAARSLTLKVEAIFSFETWVDIHPSTLRYITEFFNIDIVKDI